MIKNNSAFLGILVEKYVILLTMSLTSKPGSCLRKKGGGGRYIVLNVQSLPVQPTVLVLRFLLTMLTAISTVLSTKVPNTHNPT